MQKSLSSTQVELASGSSSALEEKLLLELQDDVAAQIDQPRLHERLLDPTKKGLEPADPAVLAAERKKRELEVLTRSDAAAALLCVSLILSSLPAAASADPQWNSKASW